MSAEEITQLLGYDLVHDGHLRQRVLDAIDQGLSSTGTNTHTITFDRVHQRVAISYDLSTWAAVELSVSDFAAFVRASTTCTTKNCLRCAVSRGESPPQRTSARSQRGRR